LDSGCQKSKVEDLAEARRAKVETSLKTDAPKPYRLNFKFYACR
jgi:hypothetical protein